MNINGDVNFNGTLFQNNGEFVTSRWTEATNQTDIYRLSKVGISKQNPTYTLEVGTYGSENGSLKVEGNTELDGTVYIGNSVNNVYFQGARMNIRSTTTILGQITNAMEVNGDRQYIDRYGMIRRNRNAVTESVRIYNAERCSTVGEIEISNDITVTIDDGAVWSII